MTMTGVEPAHREIHASETCVSTNSTTWPKGRSTEPSTITHQDYAHLTWTFAQPGRTGATRSAICTAKPVHGDNGT